MIQSSAEQTERIPISLPHFSRGCLLSNTGSYYNYVVIHYIKTQTQMMCENGKGVSLVWQFAKTFLDMLLQKV